LQEATESSTWLCSFLDPLLERMESVKQFPGTNGRICVVRGVRTSKECSICHKALHMSPPEDADTHVSCFMHYHNTGFFGLARDDCRVVRRRQKDWSFPSDQKRTLNSSQMKLIHKQHTDKRKNCNDGSDNGAPNANTPNT